MNVSNKKDLRKFKFLLFVTVLIGGLIALSCFVCFLAEVSVVEGLWNKITWRNRTEPLSDEVINDLCIVFDLLPGDDRCDHSGEEVYGPDFFDEIQKNINSKTIGWTNYDEISGKIGIYQYRQSSVIPAQDQDYFKCSYTFSGDRVYPVIIYFYTDGKIRNVDTDIFD